MAHRNARLTFHGRRLLVERVVACWFHLNHMDMLYAERLGGKEGMTWPTDEGYQRRIERAQRRYLAAIKALAQLRRLAVPVVQVNIARQQHIAQVAEPDPSERRR